MSGVSNSTSRPSPGAARWKDSTSFSWVSVSPLVHAGAHPALTLREIRALSFLCWDSKSHRPLKTQEFSFILFLSWEEEQTQAQGRLRWENVKTPVVCTLDHRAPVSMCVDSTWECPARCQRGRGCVLTASEQGLQVRDFLCLLPSD